MGLTKEDEDLDRCIAALHAAKLARSYYGASEGSVRAIAEVVTMLGGLKDEGHQSPPICLAIARALHHSYVGPLPTTPEA